MEEDDKAKNIAELNDRMDCPVHEDMKHGGKGGHMMGEEMHEGMTDKKVSDDGHDNHEH